MATKNFQNLKNRFCLAIFMIFPVLLSMMLITPASAEGIQDHPQLRQMLTDQYRDQDRDRIISQYEDCLDAGVPSGTITPMVENAARAGVDANHLESMLQEVYKTKKYNLPPGPVASKAMEGLVKNMDGRQIITAMTRVRQRMEYAAQEMKGLNAPGISERERHRMILDTAEAMASGMDRSHVHGIYKDLMDNGSGQFSREENRERTMATMEYMKRLSGYGVSPDQVAAISREMNRHRYTGEEIGQTTKAFSMARSRSWNMARFSQSVESYINNGGRGSGMGHMDWGSAMGMHNSKGMDSDHGSGSMGGDNDGGSGGGMGGGHGGMH